MNAGSDSPAGSERNGSSSLETVIITDQLARRVSRPSDHAAEARALATLIAELERPSPDILQTLAEVALSLCRAHSAGISVLEREDGREHFRWRAAAGAWAVYLGQTMPRESPCGTVIDRNATQLMAYPERHFTYAADITLPIAEALLVPFHTGGEPVGTVWVIAHDDSRHFDAEDARLLEHLARCAAAAHRLLTVHDALRAADRTKNEFIGLLAHELRNPLGVLVTATALLERGGPVDLGRTRALIRRQLEHLSRLADDLLDVTRLTTGQIRLRPRVVDLAQVVRNALETLRVAGSLEQHRLTVDAEPVPVEADPIRVEQIVLNLVGNALKFTPPGGAVTVAVRREDARAVLVIEDSGIGIPATTLPRVFEPFFQGEDADRASGGLGLGLALVRRLAELHGGAVHASSAGPGRGSTFTVVLPALAGPVPASADELREPSGGGEARTARALRILLVDDHNDTREMLHAALVSDGYQVEEAATGAEALARAAEFSPDVIVIDIGLPDIDGYEVARRLRAIRPDGVRLIALTGYGQARDRRRGEAAGFDAYLVKPVDPAELEQYLRR
ncbi:MAG TPA: ATP-binding protein [Candidatus Binatia bacterium]|nr:ATP-binding protein [Candidatus Binatia bacterium]